MYKWKCVLQAANGQTVECVFEAKWDPTKDFITNESIAAACAAEEWHRLGKNVPVSDISAELLLG